MVDGGAYTVEFFILAEPLAEVTQDGTAIREFLLCKEDVSFLCLFRLAFCLGFSFRRIPDRLRLRVSLSLRLTLGSFFGIS